MNVTNISLSSDLYDDSGVWTDLLGSGCNLNPFKRFNSSSREQMRDSHLGQLVVIDKPTPRRISTCVEREYGKFTSAITMPADGNVIKIIPKYNISFGFAGIKAVPSNAMLFDNQETGEVDYLNLETVHADHVTFGYTYNYRDIDFTTGAPIPKNTVIAASSNLKEDGTYTIGLEANVVFMAHPACIEDGVAITDSFAEKIGTVTVVDRVLSFDKYTVPLSLYGTADDDYRMYPDIGTPVNSDGILYATRKVCPVFGFITLTKKALRTLRTNDHKCIVPGNAVVNDITAFSGRTKVNQRLPTAITTQSEYYVTALSDYYLKIREEYRRLVRERGKGVKIGPNLHSLIVAALADDPNTVNYKVYRLYRRASLKDYRIEFKLTSRLAAKVGFKITDLHGGKAVVVAVIPTADAPVDQWGNIADVIIDGTTCNDRINPGRLYEQYYNASGSQLVRKLKTGLASGNLSNAAAFTTLMEWYYIISKPMHSVIEQTLLTEIEQTRHLNWTLKNQPHVWLPPNATNVGVDQLAELEHKFKLERGPLTYRDLSGNTVTTVDNFFIGSLHMIVLEKIGDDWAAVGVAKLQSFGVPAKISSADKHTSYVREQATRILGESEIRLLIALMGGEMAYKLLLLASSPKRQKEVINALYDADDLGNVPTIKGSDVDRTENRMLTYIRTLLHCYGSDLAGGISRG